MVVIDYQNRKPIYEQIVERFQMLIVKGILEPDSQMPSVRALATELSINPNTIQKAYAVLEQEGYIYPVKGRGNFVSGNQALVKQKKEDFLFHRLMVFISISILFFDRYTQPYCREDVDAKRQPETREKPRSHARCGLSAFPRKPPLAHRW